MCLGGKGLAFKRGAETNHVAFDVTEDDLLAYRCSGVTFPHNSEPCPPNGITEHARVPFDRIAHRFLRLRENGGTIFWETSANGVVWNELAQQSSPTEINQGAKIQRTASEQDATLDATAAFGHILACR